MASTRGSRLQRVLWSALLLAWPAGAVFGQETPQQLWQVRFDLDHRDDRATAGAFLKGDVVVGGTATLSHANGGDVVTWLGRWNGDTGALRWSLDVDGISTPLAIEADRKRILVAGRGRRPLQALSGRDGRTLWESRRGSLGTLAWLDLALRGKVVYAAGSQQAQDSPRQLALEARRVRDGKILWSVHEPATATAGSGWDEARLLSLDGGRLFVAGSQTGETGQEVEFVSARRTSDGEEVWRVESGPVLQGVEDLVASGGRVVAIQRSGGVVRVTALEASTGTVVWTTERGADVPASYRPGGAVVSGGILVLGIDAVGGQGQGASNDLLFLGLRLADGRELWSDRVRGAYRTGGANVTSQESTVIGGGVVFTGAESAETVLRGYGRARGSRRWELRESPFRPSVLRVRGRKLLAAGLTPQAPSDAILRVYSLPPG
ncbi:MAG: hypothetical protein R2991_03520 [Thermoanaerobaculia bacterium]